jgi:hypothetical protein
MHFMQQIINEVQVQCGGNNIALMQTKVVDSLHRSHAVRCDWALMPAICMVFAGLFIRAAHSTALMNQECPV